MDLKGMSAQCNGKYSLGGFGMAGNIVAQVSTENGSNFLPSLHLQADIASRPLQQSTTADTDISKQAKASLPFPTLATLSACKPNFLVHDVKFSGSASAQVIGLFSGVISKMVTKSMNEHVCRLIKRNGESIMDKGLYRARQYLGGLIMNGTSSSSTIVVEDVDMNSSVQQEQYVEQEFKEVQSSRQISTKQNGISLLKNDIVTWDTDMPFLKRILLSVNNVISKHLNEGYILKILQKLTTWQSSSTDCTDCGFFFKGLNGLVNSLTKGAGTLEIDVPDKFLNFHNNHTFHIPSYGDVVVTVHKLKVSGVNNFTDLALFRPEGQNLLSSSIASDAGFDVSLSVDLEVRPANGGAFHGDTLNETFELHFNTSNVNFNSSSAWEVDREMFSKLSIGSFIYGSYSVFDNNRNVLNCIIEALSSVTLLDMRGQMNIDAMHISPIVPANEKKDGKASLEDNIDELINHLLHLVLSEYPTTSEEAFAAIVQTPVRTMLNDGLENLIGDTKKMPLHCVNVDVPKNKSEQRPLRLDSTKALILFNDLVNGESAIDTVNAFISCVDNAMETKQLLAGHFYNFSMGDMKFVLHDLHMENTNSVYELEVLKPEVDHYHLANSLGYATCASTTTNTKGCDTMTSFSFGMNMGNKEQYLGNMNVHVSLQNLKVEGGTELHFDMNYFPFLQITDIVKHPQCLSVPITNFDFYGLNATVDMLEVKIDVNLSGTQREAPRTFTYTTEDSSELASVVSTLMSKGSSLLQEALGNKFTTQLNTAASVCETPVNPHRSIEMKRSTGAAGLWTFLIILAFVVGNAWLFLRGFKNDEQEEIATNDEDGGAQTDEQQHESPLTEPLLDNQDEMDEKLEVETPRYKFPLASSSSLMYHPSIQPALKYGFPAVLALAFILFFSSNLSVGASVDLLVTRADGSNLTSLVNIYAFSLGSTMKEMANAGVYLLMLLILFCSGIWPYVKLVLLAGSWVVSTRRLPPVKREKILYLLDSLGKFSLIDAYVLVLMMVAFRYDLEVEGVGALNVYVTPKYGFYAFLFATIVSLVSGHAMLFLHRRTMIPSIPVYSGRYEALAKHVFDDKHNRGLVKLTKRFRRTIVFVLFLALVLICVGVGLKSFHFKFNGVAGVALGDDRVRSYSLGSLGAHIPQSVQDSSSFGIYWIQTCYFFFALIMPMICLLSMFVLFLVPMTLKQQQKVFVLAEVANAWSAIEVFVIAIIASLIEIQPFSESMVGKHCSLLNQILGGWSGGDAEDDLHYCFDVKASIDGSSAVLIIGVILNSLLVSSLHRLAHHAIWERIEREDRPDATGDENKTVQECVLAHTFVSRLRKSPRLGAFMFEEISFGPHSEYEIDFENVTEDEGAHTSNNFWSEWSKIVSVI